MRPCKGWLLLALWACDVPMEEEKADVDTTATSRMELTFGQPKAFARSVKIDAQRVNLGGSIATPAAKGYRCESVISNNNCFELPSISPLRLNDLCASTASPAGVWNFTYSLYSNSGCTGTLLNSSSRVPLQCFDSQDVFLRQAPNQTAKKWLEPTQSTRSSILCAVGRLSHAQQPAQVYVGDTLSPSPVIQVTDAFGNSVARSGVTVTLAVTTGPAAFAPSSTLSAVTDALGRATFSQVSFSAPGNYVWTASASGFLPSQSVPVTVANRALFYAATGPVLARNSVGTATVLYPSNTQPNDLVLLILLNAFDKAVATPTGWNLLMDRLNTVGKDKYRATVWWKNAGSETSLSIRIDTDANGASLWVVRYTRAFTSTTPVTLATASVPQGDAGLVATLTPSPDLIPHSGDVLVLSLATLLSANAPTLATPRGFTLRDVETSSQKDSVSFGLADLVVTTSGTSVPSPTWSQTGTLKQWVWLTAAFK